MVTDNWAMEALLTAVPLFKLAHLLIGRKIAGGREFFTSIKTDGTLWAWGRNNFGQLGQGNITSYSSPVQIGALTDWSLVGAGNEHVLAVKTDGTLWAWGAKRSGGVRPRKYN